ncbi:MAG TPA: hypothetical protein VKG24_29765, partial [Pseudolabrys sp.]|nr:hypothetical protein [Pseudolabrys sp.]
MKGCPLWAKNGHWPAILLITALKGTLPHLKEEAAGFRRLQPTYREFESSRTGDYPLSWVLMNENLVLRVEPIAL